MKTIDTTKTITAETITIAQIRTLRTKACTWGDAALVDLCDLAIARRESSNDDGTPLIGPCGGQTTRTSARAACAEAINASQVDSSSC